MMIKLILKPILPVTLKMFTFYHLLQCSKADLDINMCTDIQSDHRKVLGLSDCSENDVIIPFFSPSGPTLAVTWF